MFIAPWDDGAVPPGWTAVLERYGLIFVSPEKAGNKADILSRRMPLAVRAAEAMLRRGDIDPDRVWVAGFSGGVAHGPAGRGGLSRPLPRRHPEFRQRSGGRGQFPRRRRRTWPSA
ncbi:MAG: hypothetical protein WDN45_06570 [Caulobacteraceae bacterium]